MVTLKGHPCPQHTFNLRIGQKRVFTPPTGQNGCRQNDKKRQEMTSAAEGEDMGEPSGTAGGIADWCSHCGKAVWGSPKNRKWNFLISQCFHFWAYYLAIKKNEMLPFVTTWVDDEGIVLTAISQTEGNK